MKSFVFLVCGIFVLLMLAGCTILPGVRIGDPAPAPDEPVVMPIESPLKETFIPQAPIEETFAFDGNGLLNVRVRAKNGRSIPNQTVTVTNTAPQVTFTDQNKTDTHGIASFFLEPGTYSIALTKAFYSAQDLTQIVKKNIQREIVLIAEQNFDTLAWEVISNDGNVSIQDPHLLNVKTNSRHVILNMEPDIIGDIKNINFSWRVKIIHGSTTGQAMVVQLFTPDKRVIKVGHKINETHIGGLTSERFELPFGNEFHRFELKIDENNTATLIHNGRILTTGMPLSHPLPLAEKKRIVFESIDSEVLIDHFLIDVDRDSVWDFRELWYTLDNVEKIEINENYATNQDIVINQWGDSCRTDDLNCLRGVTGGPKNI
jgi:hypothetical protein